MNVPYFRACSLLFLGRNAIIIISIFDATHMKTSQESTRLWPLIPIYSTLLRKGWTENNGIYKSKHGCKATFALCTLYMHSSWSCVHYRFCQEFHTQIIYSTRECSCSIITKLCKKNLKTVIAFLCVFAVICNSCLFAGETICTIE